MLDANIQFDEERPTTSHIQVTCDNVEGYFPSSDELIEFISDMSETFAMIRIEKVTVIGCRLIFNDITDETFKDAAREAIFRTSDGDLSGYSRQLQDAADYDEFFESMAAESDYLSGREFHANWGRV